MHNLGVYGTPDYSPYLLSETLKSLNISHRIIGPTYKIMDIAVTEEQPAMVYVVQNMNHVFKIQKRQKTQPYIVFLSAPEAKLKETNAIILRGNNVAAALKSALKDSHPKNAIADVFSFLYKPKNLDEYVNEATKPTFLYYIQTAIYKLTPYALVKEARTLIISALYGAIPMSKLYAFLSTTLKLEDLKMLLKDDRAKQVRALVAEAKKQLNNPDAQKRADTIVEKIVAPTNLDAFDVLYVIRSYEKMERDRISGKRRGRPPKVKPKVKSRR